MSVQGITIHPVAIDMDELVTAVARLLCLSKLAESEREHDGYCHCAAELTAIMGLDDKRVMARAAEIMDHAKQEGEKRKAAARNRQCPRARNRRSLRQMSTSFIKILQKASTQGNLS